MKIDDCALQMTKIFLSRIVDSIIKESIPRGDEDRLREQIAQNRGELQDEKRIRKELSKIAEDREVRILVDAILTTLLSSPDMACAPDKLYESVQRFEKQIIEEAQDEKCLSYSNARSVDVYQSVLEVALDDDVITPDEFALLERLRKKLGISRGEHRLMEARLGKFPKPGNERHSFDEFKEALKTLQARGIVFYCNRAEDERTVVLPDEIAPGVKKALGFEMKPDTQALLHDALTNDQLYRALAANGLPTSGSKTERSERFIKAGVKPSEVLGTLKVEELSTLCRKLPGVAVSGSKQAKVERVVDYFASLVTKPIEASDDPRAVFYQYFEEFASRDNKNLYQRGIIKHDRDMESGFEQGTRYLFEVKLGKPLIQMNGSDHADGGVEFSNGELLLWDNKGKESTYRFPKSHADQFRRYVRESIKRVNVFLVVVPEIAPEARFQAMKMKQQTETDTDVALITADDLKYVAEHWRDYSKEGEFNLDVFNATGILDRAELVDRMKVFLA